MEARTLTLQFHSYFHGSLMPSKDPGGKFPKLFCGGEGWGAGRTLKPVPYFKPKLYPISDLGEKSVHPFSHESHSKQYPLGSHRRTYTAPHGMLLPSPPPWGVPIKCNSDKIPLFLLSGDSWLHDTADQPSLTDPMHLIPAV